MKQSFLLYSTATLGSLLLLACSGETSTSVIAANADSCTLSPTEEGLAIKCGSEQLGYIKTSADGVYGASCMAEALRDDSGYKLVCGGDSVGVVYNGLHGINGVNGSNGSAGKNGANGTSCEAQPVTDGFDLFCDGKKVGTILNGTNGTNGTNGSNGADGSSCSVTQGTGYSVISCEDGTTATVNNGATGLQGPKGDTGENCSVSATKSLDNISGAYYSTITCGTSQVYVYDGIDGSEGAGCTASRVSGDTVVTIRCGSGSPVYVYDGAKGANGTNGTNGKNGVGCSATKNTLTGEITITCGAGADSTITTIAAPTNGTNGTSCTVSKVGGVATITCEDGTSAVVSDGEIGTAGYSCTDTAGVGFSVITCQVGVTAGGDPLFNADTILAAGYEKCLDGGTVTEIYNTLTHVCDAGTLVALYGECGTGTYEKATQFCAGGVAYDKADYWTEATTYPKADYGQCGTDYYVKADQYCESGVAVNKYEVCGTALYNTRTHVCDETDPAAPVVVAKE